MIPDELAARASLIPGLDEKVARFIRLEILQYEQRQKRFQPEVLALVARAQQKAAEQRAAGYDPDAVRQRFNQHLQEFTGDDPEC